MPWAREFVGERRITSPPGPVPDNGQREIECAPLPYLAFDPDASPVGFHQHFRDIEPQPDTLGFMFARDTIEPFEEMREKFRGDTASSV